MMFLLGELTMLYEMNMFAQLVSAYMVAMFL